MRLLYNLILQLYRFGIFCASFKNEKAQKWIEGRKNWEKNLLDKIGNFHGSPVVWMHCASLGEFEQGRPLLEQMRRDFPDKKYLLSFFSPSGFENCKDYSGADWVVYLPLDGYRNSKIFLDLVNPELVLFIKYEFWYYFLKTLYRRKIPAFLISATFRHDQIFFKWYGKFFRKILSYFRIITVQDEISKSLLNKFGIAAELTGDTRYDRVIQIANKTEPIPQVEQFRKNANLVIAGSTWPKDEDALAAALEYFPPNWKLVVAPHEIDRQHLQQIKNRFAASCVFYSEFEGSLDTQVLVIDNIGMLASLYRYGEIAFIGGGFNKGGIHNVLEPAIFGLPVITGPNFLKFFEAREMQQLGLLFPVNNSQDLIQTFSRLQTRDHAQELKDRVSAFVRGRSGATQKILNLIYDLS